MKGVHAVVLVAFLVLIGFLAWLAQRGDNDETLYIGAIGTLLVFALIGVFAAFAKNAEEGAQKLYFTVIGTLVGLVGGLVGGAAIGNRAGESAATDVKNQVKTEVDRATQNQTP